MKGLFKKTKAVVKFVFLPFALLIEGIVFWWKLFQESRKWGDGWSEEADDAAELDEWRSWNE